MIVYHRTELSFIRVRRASSALRDLRQYWKEVSLLCKRLSRFVIPLLLLLTLVLLPLSAVLAAEPILTITGTGLNKDVLIYQNDWGKYSDEIRYYSSNNSLDFHRIWKVQGYDLFVLMGSGNLKSGNHNVNFIARDGFKVSKTIRDLQSRYYYPRFTEEGGKLVGPMVAYYRAGVYEHNGLPTGEVIIEDKALELDDKAPRIYFGQAKGQFSEQTHSLFVSQLYRIVVGEERPVEETPQDEDPGKDTTPGSDIKPGVVTKPGGTTPGKEETKTTAPGTPSKNTDPEKDPESEAATKGEEGKEQLNGDTGNGNKPETAVDDVDNKDPEPDPGAEEKPRPIRWPWIAAGVILVVGPAAWAYFYTRMRGVQNNDQ